MVSFNCPTFTPTAFCVLFPDLFIILQATEAEIAKVETPVEQILASIDHIVKEDSTSPVAVNFKEKQRKINSLLGFLKGAAESRRNSLDESLDACKKFWPGIEKLQKILEDVTACLDSEEEPRADPKDIEVLQREHEVPFQHSSGFKTSLNVLTIP